MKFNAFYVLTALFVMIIPTAFAQTDNNEVETLSIIPKPPTDLIAISNLPINLSWTASPDPSSHIPVTHYSIERSDNSGSTWYVIATNVDISNAYNHEKAVTIDYVDSDIIIGNEYDYRVKAHNVIGESKPSEISNAIAAIQEKDKVRTFGSKAQASNFFAAKFVNATTNEPISKVLTDFEKKFVLTQDDIKELFDWRWKIIKTENMLNNSDTNMRSSKIILKDASQFFEPIYKKLKLSSITIEVYQFDFKSDQAEFWSIDEYDKTIFDVARESGFSETTGSCFFETSFEGGISGCSYGNAIIQVTIFDPYMQNYRYGDFRYNEDNSHLDSEPTLKIVNKILEKINDFKGTDYESNLIDVLRSGQIKEKPVEDSPELENDEFLGEEINLEDNSDPEKAIIAGISHFSCKKDDFGIVSITGELVNGFNFIENADITISLTDKEKNVIISDSNVFHNIEKFDTRKFLVYVNTDENFFDCRAEITSDDGLLNYQRSMRQ